MPPGLFFRWRSVRAPRSELPGNFLAPRLPVLRGEGRLQVSRSDLDAHGLHQTNRVHAGAEALAQGVVEVEPAILGFALEAIVPDLAGQFLLEAPELEVVSRNQT